jgi:hypothetical protein
MLITVDTDKLMAPELMIRYKEQRYHPYVRGMRIALEVLGIEPPEPLRRKSVIGQPRGYPPSRATIFRDKRKAREGSC